jgi:hypothetical protein
MAVEEQIDVSVIQRSVQRNSESITALIFFVSNLV